jgi:DNA-binding transcriptional MocR family regulator
MKRIVTRYQALASEISAQIRNGVLRPGDRIPSVRTFSATRGLSSNTVLQAYHLLEDRGEIKARSRSGYYVTGHAPAPAIDPDGLVRSKASTTEDLAYEVLQTARLRHYVRFANAWPSAHLYPLKRLGRAFAASARQLGADGMPPYFPRENEELKRLIARRSLEWGFGGGPDDVVVTAGAFEALSVSLRAVARPGELVAIESATLYGVRKALERFGLRPVEIATHPRDGVSLGALSTALKKHRIRACLFMPTFQHPFGSVMSDDKKRELVRLLASRDIPLIENDVYGELYFGDTRPRPAKAFDRKGLVLYCASFSKSLAPGYAVGWAVPGRFTRSVQRWKWSFNTLAGIPNQAAIVEFLQHGGFEHHLRRLRRTLGGLQKHCVQAVLRSFPAGTTVTRPAGGYLAWIELPERASALALYRFALESKITIAPGTIFSSDGKLESCLRLNYGQGEWSARLDDAVRTLGAIAASLT